MKKLFISRVKYTITNITTNLPATYECDTCGMLLYDGEECPGIMPDGTHI